MAIEIISWPNLYERYVTGSEDRARNLMNDIPINLCISTNSGNFLMSEPIEVFSLKFHKNEGYWWK